MSKYWGEYESLGDLSEDEADFEELDAIVDHDLVTEETMKIYLPYDEEDYAEIVQVPEECVKMDDTVIHTIKLLQHSKAMKELLDNANTMLQNGNEEVKALPEPPTLPDRPKQAQKYSVNYPFRYMEKEFSEFSEGEGASPVVLSPSLAGKIIRKAVSTLLAHVGFETSSESALEMLSDICQNYMEKITKLMRIAADRETMTGGTGFPDSMERVFHEMGIGSVRNLHCFYQSRIVMYHARMMHTCQQLDDEYQLLRRSLCKEDPNMRTKMMDDEDDVPEIHFPAYGEGEGDVGMLQPSLETGFQMLQSLEQESQAQMQNSEQDEEVINVSDSPSHASQEMNSTAADQSSLSGQPKSRKRKRKNNN